MYALAGKTDGSSKIAGKFGVAPLPGKDGAGVSTLGGHNYAISEFAKNKATAADFIKFMSSEERQKANIEKTSQAPTWASLYDDPALNKQFPYLAPLKASIEGAKSRPKVVKYGDVTTAIQEAAYGALTGTTTAEGRAGRPADQVEHAHHAMTEAAGPARSFTAACRPRPVAARRSGRKEGGRGEYIRPGRRAADAGNHQEAQAAARSTRAPAGWPRCCCRRP